MIPGRSELEALGRDELVTRARKLGIARADWMTRLELIEELVRFAATDDGDRRLTRSLLGKARDLVARVMELGLHLPDAAQRLRPTPSSQSAEQDPPSPLATLALAEVYASQGHREQALAVVEHILAREPGHPEAKAFRSRLLGDDAPAISADAAGNPRRGAAVPPTPPVAIRPPAHDELRMDHRDGGARLVWRVRPSSFAARRARLREGRLVVRVVRVRPSWPTPEMRTDDTEVDAFCGSCELQLDPATDTLCAAIGVRSADRFDVIAVAR